MKNIDINLEKVSHHRDWLDSKIFEEKPWQHSMSWVWMLQQKKVYVGIESINQHNEIQIERKTLLGLDKVCGLHYDINVEYFILKISNSSASSINYSNTGKISYVTNFVLKRLFEGYNHNQIIEFFNEFKIFGEL